MKRWLKISLIGMAVVLLVVLGALAWFLSQALPVGTGYTAKYLCSSTFISKRNPHTVFREDVAPLNPLFKPVDWQVNREQKSVSADYFGLFTATAIYREGCGCSLAIGTTADNMRRQTFYKQAAEDVPPLRRDDLPWPAGSRGPEAPAALGIDPAKLQKALNAGSPSDPENRRWPAAPRDAFAALGFQEQKVIIIPSKKLVLVRFGATSDRKTWNTNEFIANVLAALPD